MVNVCVIKEETKDLNFFGRCKLHTELYENKEFGLVCDILYVSRKVSKRKVRKAICEYNYVYSEIEKFNLFNKRNVSHNLIYYIPGYSLSYFAQKNNIDISRQQIGIVADESYPENLLIRLCENIKYLTLISDDENLFDKILENTGISAKKGNRRSLPDLSVRISKNVEIIYMGNVYGNIIVDFPKCINAPVPKELFFDYVDDKNCDKLIKSGQIVIKGFELDKSG